MSVDYRLTIKTESRIITPFHTDTIFGHIAWAIAYSEGPDETAKFLDLFRTNPPFIISSGFPESMLPVPILPPPSVEDKKNLAASYKIKPVDLEAELKDLKNLKYMPMESFKEAPEISAYWLAAHLLAKKENLLENVRRSEVVTTMRTTVGRITGAGLEGRLYDTDERFYDKGFLLNIWVRFFDEGYIEKFEKWFRKIEQSGYGADISTGAGRFTIIKFEKDESLPKIRDANAFMTLSLFCPCQNDPVDGYYDYLVKRGKLGGWRSVSGSKDKGANVWKKPLIMFMEGSVFKTTGAKSAYYGRMVEGLYDLDASVVQYALGFPLGIKI